MMAQKKFTILLSLIWLLSQYPTLAEAREKTEIKIGFILPLTSSNATRGEDIVRASKLYFESTNQTSDKYLYTLIFEDGKCGVGSAATTAAKKLIEIDKVKFLVTGCSGETLQAGPLAQQAEVLTFAVLSNHHDVRKLGDYVFRTFVDIENDLTAFARYIEKNLSGKLAILSEENSFTQGMKKILTKQLQDKISRNDDFSPESDFKSLLTRVKKENPSGLFLNAANESTFLLLAKQAKELGYSGALYAYLMPEAGEFKKLAGNTAHGITYLGFPYTAADSQIFITFQKEFLARHAQTLSFEILPGVVFNALTSITDSINTVGPSPAQAKEFLKTYSTPGAFGTISYDDTGDLNNMGMVLKKLNDDDSISVVDRLSVKQN